jgi:hypothetical protein
MPKMLADGGVEYEDGTPATEAQQAKVTYRHTRARAQSIARLQSRLGYF